MTLTQLLYSEFSMCHEIWQETGQFLNPKEEEQFLAEKKAQKEVEAVEARYYEVNGGNAGQEDPRANN